MPIKDKIKRSEYHKKYMREVWYPKNKKLHLLYARNHKKALRKEIDKIKNVPCSDCGVKYPHYVMDFDHHSKNKLGDVSYFVARGARNKVISEIKKCDIVCSNCHRIRTVNRREVSRATLV